MWRATIDDADVLTLEQLLSNRSRLIFETAVGSHAYGTQLPHSDMDVKGIFALAPSEYLTLEPVPSQLSDDKGDSVYYSIARFLNLAMNANPNIIELLFMPEDCIRYRSTSFGLLEANRSLFITKQAYESHVGYAHAQIKKARGQNKWINNPQPEQRPSLEDFCWLVPNPSADPSHLPYRPRPISSIGLDLQECHVAALEHSSSMYRIYHYGSGARGVFRGGKIVCESISIEDERSRCIGFLCVNEQAYERAVRDHRNYWEWRRNRNEARWHSQESGAIDYDAKNMMHTFRLLLSREAILRQGAPIVRFSGETLQFLLDIRAGKFAYDELIERAEAKVGELKSLRDQCSLPHAPEKAQAEQLLQDVTAAWESEQLL